MDFPEKVKNEDERIALMKNPEATPEDIDKVMQLPIENPDPVEEEVEEIVETPTETPAPAETPTGTPEQKPPEEEVKPKPEETLSRNWSITEADIPKDTYYDKKEGKVRPFITHKDPASLFKTVINEQKRIHYLEDVLLPQEKEQVKAEAKAEFEQKIKDLEAQIAKKKDVEPPSVQTTAATQKPVTSTSLTEGSQALTKALEDLKSIPAEDTLENTDKMHKALMAAVSQVNIQNQEMGKLVEHINQIEQRGNEIGGKVLQFETRQQEDEKTRQESEKREKANQQWQTACSLIDQFATTSPDFKSEFGTVEQGFNDMTKEAMDFHVKLAGLLFNKHPSAVTTNEQMAASQTYLRGDNPELIQRINQYGINEPKNYQAWLELDQIDAMRTGQFRDPMTKAWQQAVDPVSKEPVRLGEMSTAYSRYLDVSGKRNLKEKRKAKEEVDSVTNAIGRRDNGLVSMDTNQLRADESAGNLTEQQAVEITEQIDPQGAMAIYMRSGNREHLDRLNNALVRLGQEPMPIPDRESDVRPVKK